MNESNVNTVGEILSKARQSLGLTIAEVVANTKIRFSYIQALENDDFSKLPETAYVLGYINRYAKYLHLDSTALVGQAKIQYQKYLRNPDYNYMVQNNRLDKKYNPFNVIKENIIDFIFIIFSFGFKRYHSEQMVVSVRSNSNKSKFKSLLWLIGIIIAVILIILGFRKFKYYHSIKILDNPVTLNSKVAEELNVKDNTTNDEHKILKQDDVIVVDKPKKTITDNTTVAPPMAKFADWPAPVGNSQITITFNQSVWVRFYNKNNPNTVYLEHIFKPGEKFSVPNVPDLLLDIGNYRGIKISVNGKVLELVNAVKSIVMRKLEMKPDYLLNTYKVIDDTADNSANTNNNNA